jgi:hypothetical protein
MTWPRVNSREQVQEVEDLLQSLLVASHRSQQIQQDQVLEFNQDSKYNFTYECNLKFDANIFPRSNETIEENKIH